MTAQPDPLLAAAANACRDLGILVELLVDWEVFDEQDNALLDTIADFFNAPEVDLTVNEEELRGVIRLLTQDPRVDLSQPLAAVELLDALADYRRGLARLDMAADVPLGSLADVAEINKWSERELAIVKREMAGAARYRDYVPTGQPPGPRPTGSQSVKEAIGWLEAESQLPIRRLREIWTTRGRSAAQIAERTPLLNLVARARREHLFAASAIAGALECSERAIQRSVANLSV